MHPPPPSSIHLHPAPPSSFQPPPSSLQHPQQYLNENITGNCAIYPNLGHKQKLSILTKNWHTWYIGGANSEAWLTLLKFRPQNPYSGKFGPKNSKLSGLSENWCTHYLKDADSKSRLRVLNFRPQNPFLGKFGSKKVKVGPFSWKLAHMLSRGCLFLFQQ